MQLTEEQQRIVMELLQPQLRPFSECKPRVGEYIVLTKTELFRMNEEEFIPLCREVIPEQEELIIAFALKRQEVIDAPSLASSKHSNYFKIAIKNTLIQEISKTYMTLEIQELKEKYPSFFRDDETKLKLSGKMKVIPINKG